MGFLGRDTQREQERAERLRAWIAVRSPYALVSFCMGLLAVVDIVTMVLGAAFGVGALVAGRWALADLGRNPGLQGRRLALAGMALGVSGLAMSVVLWIWLHRS